MDFDEVALHEVATATAAIEGMVVGLSQSQRPSVAILTSKSETFSKRLWRLAGLTATPAAPLC